MVVKDNDETHPLAVSRRKSIYPSRYSGEPERPYLEQRGIDELKKHSGYDNISSESNITDRDYGEIGFIPRGKGVSNR